MKHTPLIIAAAVIFFSCSTHALLHEHEDTTAVSNSMQKLQTDIDHILSDSLLAPSFIGVKIMSLEDSVILYSNNSAKLFHPASNMKLLTTSTALQLLGPQYDFVTSVASNVKPINGILNGNVYIKGCGDPLLRTEHLDSVVLALQQAGITRITGNLIGDISRFDDLFWGLGWMWDDDPTSDAAFITPLTVNDNCITVFVTSGKHAGEAPEIMIEPNTTYIHIMNNGITSQDTTLPKLDVNRVRGENTITIKGRIPPGNITQQFTLSVWKPELYFLELFKEKLFAHGVRFDGTMIIDSSRNLFPLAEIRHPLDSILYQVNKPSDNLAAENLLKTLSLKMYGEPGSALLGLNIVKHYLQSVGIDTTLMILADGSGVSWYNALSPGALVKLLTAQYKNKSTFRHFYESLPIAGIDGTLKNRMKGTRAEGNVHAKTGSLTGVSSLSGYVNTQDGHMLVFSILCNHFPGEIVSLRNAQNKIMELLSNYNMQEEK